MKLFRFFNEESEDVYFDKSKANEVAVNEFFDQTYTASLSESITLADLVAGNVSGAGNTYNETLAESIDVSDAQQGQLVFVITLAEAIDVNDALSGSLIIDAALTQNIDVSDALVNTATLSAALGESIVVLDANTANAIVVSTLSEAVSVQEQLANGLIFVGTLSEAIILQDAFIGSAGAEVDRILHRLVLKPNTIHSTVHDALTVYTFNISSFITTHVSDMVQTKKVDLIVRRGDTFNTEEFKIEKELFDFTGTTALMRVRNKVTKALVLQPTVTMDNVVGSATAKPSSSAAQTDLLPPNEYIYDVDFTLPNGSVYTYFEGVFTVK